MKLSRTYDDALFRPEDIQRAFGAFHAAVDPDAEEREAAFSVSRGSDRWTFDNDAEFWAAYRDGVDTASYERNLYLHRDEQWTYYDFDLTVFYPARNRSGNTTLEIRLPEREAIMRVMNVLDGVAEEAT